MTPTRRPPGRLRSQRLLLGMTLQHVVSEVERVRRARVLRGGRLSRGEVSRIERAQRWLTAEQLVTLAEAYEVPPGLLCEWLLEDRALILAAVSARESTRGRSRVSHTQTSALRGRARDRAEEISG